MESFYIYILVFVDDYKYFFPRIKRNAMKYNNNL